MQLDWEYVRMNEICRKKDPEADPNLSDIQRIILSDFVQGTSFDWLRTLSTVGIIALVLDIVILYRDKRVSMIDH